MAGFDPNGEGMTLPGGYTDAEGIGGTAVGFDGSGFGAAFNLGFDGGGMGFGFDGGGGAG